MMRHAAVMVMVVGLASCATRSPLEDNLTEIDWWDDPDRGLVFASPDDANLVIVLNNQSSVIRLLDISANLYRQDEMKAWGLGGGILDRFDYHDYDFERYRVEPGGYVLRVWNIELGAKEYRFTVPENGRVVVECVFYLSAKDGVVDQPRFDFDTHDDLPPIL